jgi:hypothetical protein
MARGADDDKQFSESADVRSPEGFVKLLPAPGDWSEKATDQRYAIPLAWRTAQKSPSPFPSSAVRCIHLA